MSLIPSRVKAFYDFMIERENIRLRRLLGLPRDQWTSDPIFQKYSFTNVKREHDRVTTQLMREFYVPEFVELQEQKTDRNTDHRLQNLLINCAIFRYFGCIETARIIGWTMDWNTQRDRIKHLGDMDDLRFTSAYIVPNCGRSEPKYEVVIEILDGIWQRATEIVEGENSWRRQCGVLTQCYGCGSFMAKEIMLDYILATGIKPDDWQTWTPVGPGGRRGASRVLHGVNIKISEEEALEVIMEIYEERGQYWRADFVELDLTDIQFQCCEVSKYSGVAEGRAPKRRFKPIVDEITRKQDP
jgi:hypothetical protein